MADTKWTNEQLQAIEKSNSNILVAAAAGSGKTAVLVERIIRKIINDNIDIDSILVVTFTNAAASEMRERISKSIYKKIEEEPDNVNLQRQINLINKANICTIHSFCLDVIRNNFFEIDISPNFRIGDSSEIELIKLDTLEELFEEKYEINDKDFIKLVETYTGYRGDEPLKEIILKIYKFIQSSPFPIDWLEEKTQEFNIDKNQDFGQTIWGKILLNNFKELIDDTIKGLEQVVNILKQNYELDKYINSIQIDLKNLDNLKTYTNSWDKLYEQILNFKFEWPRGKKVESNILDEGKTKRDKITKKFNDEKNKIFAYTSKDINEDLIDNFELLNILKNIIIEFDEKYLNKKKEKNIIDFNDIEHFALKILVAKDENGNYIPTNVAKKYREKFNEIAIDEYQDSNLVQEYILSTISKGNNIFMVGDVKQSIYKFRQARPELFLQKYNSYKNIDEIINNEENTKIKLFKNFRSRDNILNITNTLFEEIMQEELGDINYNEEEFLNLGADYPETNNSLKTELHIIDLKDKDNDTIEEEISEDTENEEPIDKAILEAKFTAKKIQELINSDFYVLDKNEGKRKLQYKDIVILLRATSNVAQIFEKEIAELNIPVYSDSSAEYLESVEIETIMSVLKIIDNPMQDIPLVTVLRSMIGNLTDNELVEIRLCDKYCSFYETLKKAIIQVDENLRNKIELFLHKIKTWREEQEYLSLAELIWKIYEDTGYFEYVGLMPNGELRKANLKMLFEKAKAYENASFTGLFNFINFIEKLKLSNGDMGAAKIIGENENVVRIMSIHKSKGLEFPVVFLSNTSKRFNMQDLNDTILLDQDIGIGPKYIDYLRSIEYNTFAKEAIKIKAKKDIISEEMRVLYVALTRAREKLIITGTSKDLEKELEQKKEDLQICNNKKIDKSILKKYISYLDWIELVYEREKDNIKNYFEVYKYSKYKLLKEFNQNEDRDKIEEKNRRLQDKIDNSRTLSNEIIEKLNWKYQKEESTKIKSKMSVTEIKAIKNSTNTKHDSTEETRKAISLNIPKFIEEQKTTNARKGTIIHLCMQKLDIKEEYNIEKINQLVYELVERKIIYEAEAESINLNKVLNFTKNKIWKEMKEAKIIEKEKPFYINIPANEIYKNKIQNNILVQGIIDLYYINKDNELVLVDYKTDYVENKDEEELKNKYKKQLKIYKSALEQAMNKKVSKIYIYSTYLDKEIELEVRD